jgi:tetratricopeptide (TPR) repeat protein
MNPHFLRAQLLYQQNRFEQAMAECRQAIADDARNPMAYAILGLCLVELGKTNEAEEAARQAVAIAPDAARAYYALGIVLLKRNKYADAEQAADQALQYEPFTPEYLALLAQARISRKNWKGALEAAEQGLSLDAENVDCNNLRAMALVNLGRQSEAAATLSSTLQNDPTDATTHANLGWTMLQQGNDQQALHHFKESLRLDPTSEWAQAGLVEAMKARFWPYRILLRVFLWANRFSDGVKIAVLLGAYFGNQILRSVEANYPKLAPFVAPLTIAYFILVLITWFGVPLANLALMAHPLGRMALPPRAKRHALMIAACLLTILFAYVSYLMTEDPWHVILGLTAFFLMFPISTWNAAGEGRTRKMLGWYTLALLALAAYLLIAPLLMQVPGLLIWWDIFRWGCILSSFVAVGLPLRSRVR